MSWTDVRGFLQHLNLLAGEELYFLATEAEWVYDIYGAYTDSGQINPSGVRSGSHSVIRGTV